MTKVAFRMDKRGDKDLREVTAVFTDYCEITKTYMCYNHNGAHSQCTGLWVVEDTRPAKPEEYAPLLDELKNLVGYDDLEVVKTARWVK